MSQLPALSKLLISAGFLLILAGVLWALVNHFGVKHLHLGRLPGDIVIGRANYRFYFPIMTSILLSLLLSILLWLFRFFRH